MLPKNLKWALNTDNNQMRLQHVENIISLSYQRILFRRILHSVVLFIIRSDRNVAMIVIVMCFDIPFKVPTPTDS